MKEDPKLWLYRLFNSTYFDPWLTISYLQRYNTPGIHYYLCTKLRTKSKKELTKYLPHLVHVMLMKRSNDENTTKYVFDDTHIYSYGVYDLIKDIGDVECYFSVYSRSKSNPFICDILCNQIIENSKITRRLDYSKFSKKINEIKYLKNSGSKNKNIVELLEDKEIMNNLNDLKNTKDINYSKEEKEITSADSKKILEKNTPIFSSMLSRKIFVTPSIPNVPKKTINIQGILVFFVRSISSIFSRKLSIELKDYEKIYEMPLKPTKIPKNLNIDPNSQNENPKTNTVSNDKDSKTIKINDLLFKGTLFKSHSNMLKPTIMFFKELVSICKRLKYLPKVVRSKGFGIEIEMINYNLPNNIQFPFGEFEGKYVLNIVSEHSYILDSAENSPFFVCLELGDLENEKISRFKGYTDINKIKSGVCVLENTDSVPSLEKELSKITIEEEPKQNISISNDNYYHKELMDDKDGIDNASLAKEEDFIDDEEHLKFNEKGKKLLDEKENVEEISSNEQNSYETKSDDSELDNSENMKVTEKKVEVCNKIELNTTILEESSENKNIEKNDVKNTDLGLNENKKAVNKIADKKKTTSTEKINEIVQKESSDVEIKKASSARWVEKKLTNENENMCKISDVHIDNVRMKDVKNSVYLLHQLYNLKNNTNFNVYEVNLIKEKILQNFEKSILKLKSNGDEDALNSSKFKINEGKPKNKMNNSSSWAETKEMIRKNSKFSKTKGYEIISAIIKRGKDLRQEVLAIQILEEMKRIFEEEKLPIYLKTYKIMIIDAQSALIETVNDLESIHVIKKNHKSLKEYYIKRFNGKDSLIDYEKAVLNFLQSLVGYSLASYLLQIKDRHNGNILINTLNGRMVHVDFGFILGDHPGYYNVERAPFKFSTEYIEMLETNYDIFKSLFIEGFMALRKNSDRLCRIIEIMAPSNINGGYTSGGDGISCINKYTMSIFRDRLKMEMGDAEVVKFVNMLIEWSISSMATGLYDSYQYFSNGYMK